MTAAPMLRPDLLDKLPGVGDGGVLFSFCLLFATG
jgi:hypothetical protein